MVCFGSRIYTPNWKSFVQTPAFRPIFAPDVETLLTGHAWVFLGRRASAARIVIRDPLAVGGSSGLSDCDRASGRGEIRQTLTPTNTCNPDTSTATLTIH